MVIQPLVHDDIKLIPPLIPPDWTGALPTIEAYTRSGFCFSFKVSIDNNIVGTGTTIVHNETAWLAHILVHPDYRNRNIGTAITQKLVGKSITAGCKTIYLLATELGEPVYRKAGFEPETDYFLFKSDSPLLTTEISDKIIPVKNNFKSQIYELDRQVSGENRMVHLEKHLENGFIYLHDNKVQGFYLPDLGDGLIIAISDIAGQELMKLRLRSKDFAAFPADNLNAVNFFGKNNFKQVRTQKRMRFGKKRKWQPENIYNRIGGNLG